MRPSTFKRLVILHVFPREVCTQIIFVYMGAMMCAWRSEDSLWKSVIFSMCLPGIKLRVPGLVANIFTC